MPTIVVILALMSRNKCLNANNLPTIVQSLASKFTIYEKNVSDMRFQTLWYVRPAKAQTSLRIRAV